MAAECGDRRFRAVLHRFGVGGQHAGGRAAGRAAKFPAFKQAYARAGLRQRKGAGQADNAAARNGDAGRVCDRFHN